MWIITTSLAESWHYMLESSVELVMHAGKKSDNYLR